MIVDNETQRWVKINEGLKLKAYVDTNGHLSIGWGRNLENGIRPDEAELMFQNDLKQTVSELTNYEWFVDQPQHVKNALINMNFNLGITKFLGFKKMIAAIIDRNYTLAAIEALDSLWAKQVGQRAKDIALMIREA